jgi:uncharacterized protein
VTTPLRLVPPEELPSPVEEVEHFTIELSDGTHLAARRWQPVGAEQAPVPAVLEYIPYRKRDKTVHRDGLSHPYVAAHGYACVRVDLRGAGDSEGVLTDEYLPLELEDGLEVLRWLAAQPWCDGRVGIIGKSWGGFNGLQLAALRPPELGAVVTVCSTDDRYADDVHYMGGCLLGDNLSWSSSMFAYTSCPPDPELVGDRWRQLWRERLEGSGLWLETWLEHQHRDAYWQHGSVCEDYTAIEVPVMAVSGWADGYSNAVFRLLEHLDVPRRALVGPWSHKYPHLGVPGPAIGFLQECVRWWDRWLKGLDNGVDAEPPLALWMQDSIAPALDVRDRPGRWLFEPSWPSPNVEQLALVLGDPGDRGLRFGGDVDEDATPHSVASPLSVGHLRREVVLVHGDPGPADRPARRGRWVPHLRHRAADRAARDPRRAGVRARGRLGPARRAGGRAPVRPSPRRPDHAGHLRRAEPDPARLPRAPRAARAGAVLPRAGAAQRGRPPVPRRTPAAAAGLHLVLAGDLAPAPPGAPHDRPVGSRLLLPVHDPQHVEDAPTFGPPEGVPPPTQTVVEPRDYRWTVTRDMITGESTLETVKDEGAYRLEDIDLEIHSRTVERYTYRAGDYRSPRGEVETFRRFVRGDWDVSTRTRTVLTCTPETFVIHAELDAYEHGRRVFTRLFDRTIPRDLL